MTKYLIATDKETKKTLYVIGAVSKEIVNTKKTGRGIVKMVGMKRKTIEMLTQQDLIKLIEILEAKVEALEDSLLRHLIDHKKHER